MFDTIVLRPPSHKEYIDRNVTVHEHRAPTDESVKLMLDSQILNILRRNYG